MGNRREPEGDRAVREADPTAPEHRYAVADARRVKWQHRFDLILSSLPFGLNIIGSKKSYSDNPNDLSNSPDYGTFFKMSGK